MKRHVTAFSSRCQRIRSSYMVIFVALSTLLGILVYQRISLKVLSIGMGTTMTTMTSHGSFGSTSKLLLPEVCWLMTYPNSGTTYTLKNIQVYTQTTTATNYGNEASIHNVSVPVHTNVDTPAHDDDSIETTTTATTISKTHKKDIVPNYTNGPFLRLPHLNLPRNYILTKTHCGGTALEASPVEYVETFRSFEVACRSGNRIIDNEQKVDCMYDMNVPKRAVHLIRNPFDNIVARLHLSQKRWKRSETKTKMDQLETYNATREGFRAWCVHQDIQGWKKERNSKFMDEELWDVAKHVPCHGEWIRYTLWHNHAIDLTTRYNLPVHYLFYEDYETNWEDTIESLFQFLDLHPTEGVEPLPFLNGKHYIDYFDVVDIYAAKQLVQLLASPETWNLLKDYF